MPTTPQVYNFNTNTVTPPQVTITAPSVATVAIAPGTAIQLKATASVDASLTISSVVFNINGQSVLKRNVNFVKGNLSEIEVSRLPKGVYIVNASYGNIKKSIKIIKN